MANKAVKVFLRNGHTQLIYLDELDNLDFDFRSPPQLHELSLTMALTKQTMSRSIKYQLMADD